MKKLHKKEVSDVIKKVLRLNGMDVLDLRDRLVLNDVIFQEDYLILNVVLDLYDLLDLLINNEDDESINEVVSDLRKLK